MRSLCVETCTQDNREAKQELLESPVFLEFAPIRHSLNGVCLQVWCGREDSHSYSIATTWRCPCVENEEAIIPRKRKPARLHLRKRADGPDVWEIRDFGVTPISTQTADRDEAEKKLLAYIRDTHGFAAIDGDCERDLGDLDRLIYVAVRKARERAGAKGLAFDITLEDMRDIAARQDHRCAISGLAFDVGKSLTGRRRPYAPSIDRIDNAEGYTMENVRLVASIVNLARGDFSDSEFFAMCRAVARLN